MKLRYFATVSLAAVTLAASALPARAQTPATPPPASAPVLPPEGGRGAGMGRRMMANLTPEEQSRVQAARKASNRDPAVVSARRALMQAERDAMLRQDPTLGPILDKMRPGGGRRRGADQGFPGAATQAKVAGPNAAPTAPDNSRALAMLTPDERTRLANAQRTARQDPAVVSARQAMQSAVTADDRRAARQNLQEALRAAMTRADAGIGPIMEKVGRDGGAGGNRA